MTGRAWLVIGLAGLGTWGMRASLILLFGRVAVPPLLQRSFRYVAPSVMAAIAVPAFIAPDGVMAISVPHLTAAVAAGLVAWRFSSFVGTLVAGLATFTLMSNLL